MGGGGGKLIAAGSGIVGNKKQKILDRTNYLDLGFFRSIFVLIFRRKHRCLKFKELLHRSKIQLKPKGSKKLPLRMSNHFSHFTPINHSIAFF